MHNEVHVQGNELKIQNKKNKILKHSINKNKRIAVLIIIVQICSLALLRINP